MAAMYDDAVELLAGAGFRQLTMRQFRRDTGDDADEYRCQRHGMVGLGAGARSYTAGLHYSTPWKMLTKNIRAEIEGYSVTMMRGDDAVRFGIELDDDERRRRFVIQSLLYDGLDLRSFQSTFSLDARELFASEWALLREERCIVEDGAVIRLSARGMRHADIVGNLFFSERVQALIEAYEYDT
jgi:oxygen-independent coproporphyrinogen-3 oxidase